MSARTTAAPKSGAAAAPKRAAKKKPTRKPPARSAVARDEVADAPAVKTVEFRGQTLTLADQLPATALLDFQIISTSGGNPMPLFALLQSLIGEQQFVEVRNALASANSGDEVFAEIEKLLDDCLEQYGFGLGDS